MNPYWRLTSNPYVFTPPPPAPGAPGAAGAAGAAGAGPPGPYSDGRNGTVGTSPLGLQTCSKAGKGELMDRPQSQLGDLFYCQFSGVFIFFIYILICSCFHLFQCQVDGQVLLAISMYMLIFVG